MRAPVVNKYRMRLPTAGDGAVSKVLEEAKANLNQKDSEKLSAADLLYLKRQVQRRLGGGAEVGQMKAESERDTRDDLSRELVEELSLAGLELPHLEKLTRAELQALKEKLLSQKRRGGAKKFRSRTSDSTPYFKFFSIPHNFRRALKSWGGQILICFLICLFMVIGIVLFVAANL